MDTPTLTRQNNITNVRRSEDFSQPEHIKIYGPQDDESSAICDGSYTLMTANEPPTFRGYNAWYRHDTSRAVFILKGLDRREWIIVERVFTKNSKENGSRIVRRCWALPDAPSILATNGRRWWRTGWRLCSVNRDDYRQGDDVAMHIVKLFRTGRNLLREAQMHQTRDRNMTNFGLDPAHSGGQMMNFGSAPVGSGWKMTDFGPVWLNAQ